MARRNLAQRNHMGGGNGLARYAGLVVVIVVVVVVVVLLLLGLTRGSRGLTGVSIDICEYPSG